MKRFKILLLLTFITIIFSLEANSQCPPGWSSTSVQYGPEPNTGCYYQVDFCYICQVTTSGTESTLRITKIKPLGRCASNPPDADWLRTEIWDTYFNYCTIEPCTTSCIKVIIEYPICFQWHTEGWIIDGQYHYWSWLDPCPEADPSNPVNTYCQSTSFLCLQNGQVIACPNNPTTTYQMINYLSCQANAIPEPTQFNPDFEGEKPTSECFKYETCP